MKEIPELHLAAFEGHLEKVDALLKQGVDASVPDSKGWTALHWACQEGYLDIAWNSLAYSVRMGPI